MRAEKLKVLIVDDHVLVRRGIRSLLEDEPDFGPVGEADNGAQALRRVRDEPWDVVLMDIDMPGPSAFQVTRSIKQNRPALPILVLTMYPERQFAMRMLGAGASGYMTKAAAPEHLVTAIHRLVEGMAYVSSSVARQLVCGKSSVEDKEPHELLSGREIDVLRAIASGVPLAKIASDMFISPKTVTTYRARIFDKLNLASNTELVRYALDHGLIR